MATEAPNTWSVLHDDAKSYITLSTALLGLSATFADRLLSDDTLGRYAVFAGWLVLVLSIVSSISANGQVVGGLKKNSTNYNATSGWLNAAVILLLVGTSSLTFGAWRTSIGGEAPTPESPSILARQTVAEMMGASETELVVESLEKRVGNDFVLIVRTGLPDAERLEVTVDGDRHEVTLVRAVP